MKTSSWRPEDWPWLKAAESLINAVCVIIFVLMIGMVFLNVVLRYGFNTGISTSVELSRFIFVWITYLGSIVALAHNQHLSIPVLYRYLPGGFRNILARLVLLVMALLSIVFAVGTWQQMQLNWANLAPVSGVPTAVFYLAGFVSACLMTLVLVFKFLFTPNALYQEQGLEPVAGEAQNNDGQNGDGQNDVDNLAGEVKS